MSAKEIHFDMTARSEIARGADVPAQEFGKMATDKINLSLTNAVLSMCYNFFLSLYP